MRFVYKTVGGSSQLLVICPRRLFQTKEVTSKASTQTQAPLDKAFFRPVAAMVSV